MSWWSAATRCNSKTWRLQLCRRCGKTIQWWSSVLIYSKVKKIKRSEKSRKQREREAKSAAERLSECLHAETSYLSVECFISPLISWFERLMVPAEVSFLGAGGWFCFRLRVDISLLILPSWLMPHFNCRILFCSFQTVAEAFARIEKSITHSLPENFSSIKTTWWTCFLKALNLSRTSEMTFCCIRTGLRGHNWSRQYPLPSYSSA